MEPSSSASGKWADYAVNRKIILAGLWTAMMFCFIYGDYFELYVPGKVRGLLEGHAMLDDPWKLLIAAVVLALPALMIVFSLILRSGLNRALNMVMGILYALIMVATLAGSIGTWYLFYLFFGVIEIVLGVIIFFTPSSGPGNDSLVNGSGI